MNNMGRRMPGLPSAEHGNHHAKFASSYVRLEEDNEADSVRRRTRWDDSSSAST